MSRLFLIVGLGAPVKSHEWWSELSKNYQQTFAVNGMNQLPPGYQLIRDQNDLIHHIGHDKAILATIGFDNEYIDLSYDQWTIISLFSSE